MKSDRGTVRRITFEIEYPDGRRKERVFDGSDGIDPGDIHAIVFHDSFVQEGDGANFTISDDWTKNPTMGVYSASRDGKEIVSNWPCLVSAPNNC